MQNILAYYNINTIFPSDETAMAEKIGFQFGEKGISLPEGWSIYDEKYYSYVVDEKKRRRVFYKYENNCLSARLIRRVNFEIDTGFTYGRGLGVARIFKICPYPQIECDLFKTQPVSWGRQREECKGWLEKNYPLWEDFTAYWDID